MFRNNKTSLTLTKNPKSQNKTKYINVIHHYIQGLVENRKLAINQVASSAIFADSFTKVIFVIAFKKYYGK